MTPPLAFCSSHASQLASGAALTGDGRLFFHSRAISSRLADMAAVLVFPPPGKDCRLFQSRRDVAAPFVLVALGSLVVGHQPSRSSPSFALSRRSVARNSDNGSNGDEGVRSFEPKAEYFIQNSGA